MCQLLLFFCGGRAVDKHGDYVTLLINGRPLSYVRPAVSNGNSGRSQWPEAVLEILKQQGRA